MAKRIEDFKVTRNHRLTKDIFILEISGNNYMPQIKPGQFLQVRVDGSPGTFLRRPFSVHDVDYERNTIRILVQIAGKGTERLSELNSGDSVNIIYPLGNSFSLPGKGEKTLLIGGGCGIAPLLFLAKNMISEGCSPEILLGFRNSDRIIEYDEYAALGQVYLTTEDGSKGEKGFVTQHPVLNEKKFDRVYCCGPEPMMKAVGAWCIRNGVNCEVSLENLMGCGFGVCLCCVVDTVKGNLCTCTDGPVFNIKELKW
jgi:dihydroorotate dehydrogenase electron transfer subunit